MNENEAVPTQDSAQIVEKEKRACTYLIVDTSAFIRQVKLERLANEVYTVPEVMKEIRDRQAREGLTTLGKDIQQREPSPEDVKHIVNFAKKTGDYASLSVTDIKLLALTLMFEREHHGLDHLRKDPVSNVVNPSVSTERQQKVSASSQEQKKPSEPAKEESPSEPAKEKESPSEPTKEQETPSEPAKEDEKKSEEKEMPSVQEEKETVTQHLTGVGSWEDDDEGWITPDNLHLTGQFIEAETEEVEKGVTVGCLTMDYAMQNVLLQLGLNLISIDGMKIKNVKQFILWCKACFKTTQNMEKMFCPNCGNHTLRKVAYSIDQETGKVVLHLRKQGPEIRGKRFPLPLPKGGRTGQKLILREDQLPAHRRKRRVNFYDAEGVFGEPRKASHEDTYVMGFGSARRNPNETKHRSGKRKKRNRPAGYRS